MEIRLAVAAFVVGLSLTACAPEGDAGTWVGTIATEGNITTVVNESGSVWGGTATLVEETSIGVESGAPEYMLGAIGGLYATDDEIYVADLSNSVVHVYDRRGNHLRSFGRQGQGPGEFGREPMGVTVDNHAQIYVGDPRNRRVNIFSPEGETVGVIAVPPRATWGLVPLVLTDEGAIALPIVVPNPATPGQNRYAVSVHTAEGRVGEEIFVPQIEYQRRFVRVQGRDIPMVPFAANLVWTFGYDQTMSVGASDRYEFRRISPTGETTLVERFWEPVPVTADEAEYWRRVTVAQLSGAGEISWNGENIPDQKPAYLKMIPSASGELWLLRDGRGEPAVCDLEPEAAATSRDTAGFLACLHPNLIVDVFARDGRYLGDVEGLPASNALIHLPFISGDTVIAQAEDEAGTIMVKRYRLVLPGEREH